MSAKAGSGVVGSRIGSYAAFRNLFFKIIALPIALLWLSGVLSSCGGSAGPAVTPANPTPPATNTGTATVYAAPAGETLSSMYTVAVQSQSSPVYNAPVQEFVGYDTSLPTPGTAGFTSFDFSGTVQVVVTYSEAVTSAIVLPTSYNITPTVAGSQITFSVTNPGQMVVEVNGDKLNSLQVFANPVETNVPSATAADVLYYAPGVHQLPSTVFVTAGQTVYIAGGAVLYAQPASDGSAQPVFDLKGANITFRGRGVIDGSLVANIHSNDIIHASGTSGLNIEGVIFRDSGSWNINLSQSSGATITNVKAFSSRLNTDGIDVDSSQSVTISNSFLRNYDDLITMKTNYPPATTTNVNVSNMVLWNEKAHALDAGTEIEAGISDITFSNSDIVRDTGHDFLLAVENADAGTASAITFQDIRVEEANGLMNAEIVALDTSVDATRGQIQNVTFSDITAPTPTRGAPAQLAGYGPQNLVSGVQFENCVINGSPLTASQVQQNSYVTGVTITP